MTLDQWLVTIGGIAASIFIAWFFWFSRNEGVAAAVSASGVQEAQIIVKGGYTPDVVVVKAGRPVRLLFRREETAACSEMVVFKDFDKSAKLPAGQTTVVEVLPEKPGVYEFTCQMGMFRGRLVAE